MTRRAMILMRDVIYGSPAQEIAETWQLPCAILESSDLEHCVGTAASVIDSHFGKDFLQIVEINFDDDVAALYMANLRLQNAEMKIMAFWFSTELEVKVKAWKVADCVEFHPEVTHLGA